MLSRSFDPVHLFFLREFQQHSQPSWIFRSISRHFNILAPLSSLSKRMAAGIKKQTPEKTGKDDIKTSLMNKYGEMFIDKLTTKDLDEFQFFLRKQYDKESGWNNEYKLKFESKLRQYFHEEVMRREIASIETLLGLLDRRDLKNKT
jgi:hypothetical protein